MLSDKQVMTLEEYGLLKGLIDREFGITLKGDKRFTLHTKVSHRLPILGLKSYSDYYDFLTSDSSRNELFVLASHLTNNETYFFREKPQLKAFSEILREIKKDKQRNNQKSLNILSLASSSGEEAYTLNMLIQESGLFIWDWDVRITGIDIDKNAIKKAGEACYGKNSFRANGNMDFINKYFMPDGERYTLKKSLTKNVEFRHGNLLESDSFDGIREIDVIFCRNVFIYMSDTAIDTVIGNLHNCISDDGYLFVGSSESLIQRTALFLPEYVNGIIVYRKNAAN